MKKVLFIANHKGFSKFNAPYMQWFKDQGWQVDNASPGIEVGNVDNQFDVDIQRSPLSFKNFKALKDLKRIIDKNKYNIIHVHTPMGAFLGRLASIASRKRGTKVIYTAHGFHFYKGAPLKNWIIYYPIEKLLARFTDALVTINYEDFQRARYKQLAKGNIYHINGIGVNLTKFHPFSTEQKVDVRKEFNLSANDFIGLYTAQFIPRKNHKFLIETLPQILKAVPNFKMMFAGNGETYEESKKLAASLGIEKSILFLGARSDIAKLCGLADVHISPSFQEGLAIGNIEAMATGCPLIISKIRGHIEVCEENKNGFLFDIDNPNKIIDSVAFLANNVDKYNEFSAKSLEKAKEFSLQRSISSMETIYKTLM